jgi:4,4'-diaponeurosporenoate glycosyltransferase
MIWLLLAVWMLGFLLLWRVPRCQPVAAAGNLSELSIIIPARNEAENIQGLLASITNQSCQPLEILVVDDASEDETARLAREGGGMVVSGAPLPEGWRGKTWACHQGAQQARGTWLLFLDADTRLQGPDALARIWKTCGHYHAQAMSLGPYHEVRKPYEQLSAFFNLLTFMGMRCFGWRGDTTKPSGLFGPSLLVRREAYNAVGGHEAVKNEVLENLSLCPLLEEKRVPLLCLGGRGVLHVRMYPGGMGELIKGWTKAFVTGADKTPRLIFFLSVLWLSGAAYAVVALPFVAAADGAARLQVLLYPAYAMQLFFLLRKVGSFSALTALLYPLPQFFFFTIMLKAACMKKLHRQVEWKGRRFDAAQGEAS